MSEKRRSRNSNTGVEYCGVSADGKVRKEKLKPRRYGRGVRRKARLGETAQAKAGVRAEIEEAMKEYQGKITVLKTPEVVGGGDAPYGGIRSGSGIMPFCGLV
jgi:hypothetical protein